MGVREFLGELGIRIISEGSGSNYHCECSFCGSGKMYVNKTNAMFDCKTSNCKEVGNAWPLMRHWKTDISNREGIQLLERHGIGVYDGSGGFDTGQDKIGNLNLGVDDIASITFPEFWAFCKRKKVSARTVHKLMGIPFFRVGHPELLFFAYDPRRCTTAAEKACCGVRMALNNDLICTGKDQKTGELLYAKYATIKGSTHTLWGVKWLNRQVYDTIYYCEGWKDMLVYAEMGLVATANTGGAGTWKDIWLQYFVDKTVYINFDADQGGVDGMAKAWKAIGNVAKEVIFTLVPYEVIKSNGPDAHDFAVSARPFEQSVLRDPPKLEA